MRKRIVGKAVRCGWIRPQYFVSNHRTSFQVVSVGDVESGVVGTNLNCMVSPLETAYEVMSLISIRASVTSMLAHPGGSPKSVKRVSAYGNNNVTLVIVGVRASATTCRISSHL